MSVNVEQLQRSAAADQMGHSPDPTLVDVVIVTFNSAKSVGACLRTLEDELGLNVIVVDNASSDETVESLSESNVRVMPQTQNLGFAAGSNIGWRAGRAPYVLFLNPDAVINGTSLHKLVRVLEGDATVGVVAPRFVYPSGRLAYYLRRFPRISSTFAQALHLHHLLPKAAWTSEVIAHDGVYDQSGPHDWVPGACLLTRRSLVETLGGFDETFFMYCEDKDFCKRTWETGFRVWYEPEAVCVHEGGASAPRASLLPVLAESRMRYLSKHSGLLAAGVHRIGLVLEAAARLVFVRGGWSVRAGHARALLRLMGAGR